MIRAAAVDATGFALPLTFWSTFVRRQWERKPMVIERPFDSPLTNPEAVFAGLLRAGNARRPREFAGDARFYIENAQVLADTGKYLPRRSDRSIDRYAARVTKQIDGRRFGLTVSRFHIYDPALWFRVREFLSGLFAAGRPGAMPPGPVKLTLFLGNYRNTPYGVHLGGASNFKFIIAGKKRMRLWSDTTLRDKDTIAFSNVYRRQLRGSVALDGNAGDVLYFPSHYWHVAEDSGRLSLSISVDLFVQPEPAYDPPGAAESTLLIINRSTASGFGDVPPARSPRRLSGADVILGDPRNPIRWTNSSGGELVCSANGHACSAPRLRAVTNLLERLNAGAPVRVLDAVRDHSGGRLSRANARVLLEKLYAFRAIEVISMAAS